MGDDLYDFPIPGALREVASRHQRHVTNLAEQLRSFGLESGQIERSVDQLITSYRTELIEAVKAVKGPSDDRA